MIAFIGASLAWWLERAGKPEFFYLHLCCRSSVEIPGRIPWPNADDHSRLPICLTTAMIATDVPFELHLPSEKGPSFSVFGNVRRLDGEQLKGHLRIVFQPPHSDPFDFEEINFTSIMLEKATPLDDPNYFFVISQSEYDSELPAIRKYQ